MINRNELESQIHTAVNANDDFYTDDQVSQIADMVMGLDGFSLTGGDDLDSVDTDVFWRLALAADLDVEPRHYAESEWRAQE